MAETQNVADVMTPNPVIVRSDAVIAEAAKAMRDSDIGDVLVKDGKTIGIVTDRDIVVRAIATGKDPASTRIGEIVSSEVETVAPDSPVEDAIKLMREHAIRRLPVVEGGEPVGVLSIGDLAIERDPRSALADISESPPNT